MQLFRAIGFFAATLIAVWLLAVIVRVRAMPASAPQTQHASMEAGGGMNRISATDTPTQSASHGQQAQASGEQAFASLTTYEQHIAERSAPASSTSEPASTQIAAEELEPETSPFSAQLNLDITNAYYYRGILQEDTGVIVQPSANFTINLLHHDGFKIDALLGAWNSFHSPQTGPRTHSDFTNAWYEMDLIAGVAF